MKVPDHDFDGPGGDVVHFLRANNLNLDPWQSFVLRESLRESSEGEWAAFEVGLVVPRQNGKGAILEGREIAGLFLLGEKLILHSAHEFKTAREQFLRVLSVIENAPDLDRMVHKVRNSHGEEGIELRNGNRLRFVARSQGSGRGFSGDVVILDEAYELSTEAMAALLPTLSARPNPQLWYASSAGKEQSLTLRSLRERGLSGEDSEGLAYFEWSAEDDADPLDRTQWAVSNPALGIRISEKFIAREQQALEPPVFARERLGIWFNASRYNVVDMLRWQTLADRNSHAIGIIVFGLDVSPDREFASIGMAGTRGDGDPHVEVIEDLPGTDWIIAEAKRLTDRWHPVAFMVDPNSPAGALIGKLRAAGVPVEEISLREFAQGCGAIVDGINDGTQRHRDQQPLTAALTGANKRATGDGAWVWNRKHATVNICPLVAVTIAKFGLSKYGTAKKQAYAAAEYG